LTSESDVATLSAPPPIAQEISLDSGRDSVADIVVTREQAEQWIALTIDAMAFDNEPVRMAAAHIHRRSKYRSPANTAALTSSPECRCG